MFEFAAEVPKVITLLLGPTSTKLEGAVGKVVASGAAPIAPDGPGSHMREGTAAAAVAVGAEAWVETNARPRADNGQVDTITPSQSHTYRMRVV